MKDSVENNKCLTSTRSTENGEDVVQNQKKSGIKLISYKAKKVIQKILMIMVINFYCSSEI